MLNVIPQVYLIGQTIPDKGTIARYLRDQGYKPETFKQWLDIPNPNINDLVEFYGRLCYASFDTSLNENLTKVRTDQADYLENILASGHGSVLESCSLNFVIRNCSRVVTHELVRHRVGTHISQESMRYVRLDSWNFVYPGSFFDESLPNEIKVDLSRLGTELNDTIQRTVNQMADLLEMDKMTFTQKKRYTSALRRWLPNGIATQFGWSANIRTLRHVIAMRSSDAAEEEVRQVAHQLAMICKDQFPLLFPDLKAVPPYFRGDAPVWASRFQA